VYKNKKNQKTIAKKAPNCIEHTADVCAISKNILIKIFGIISQDI